jgi:Restriction endonuclease/Topoisomerase DNA binding C4 zinc finger
MSRRGLGGAVGIAPAAFWGNMARKTKQPDRVGMVAQFPGTVLLLGLILPQVRQTILAVGIIAVAVVGLAVLGLIGFGVYRLATRSQREEPVERCVDWHGAVMDSDPQTPETTAELIQQLRRIDWYQFEQIVALVYRKFGYAVTRRGGANPDGGIDLIIERNGQCSAVQCKHWRTWNLGVKAVREFLGALTDAGIDKGIFVALGGYTGEARQLAEKHGIEIVNETDLALMLDQTDARFDPDALEILNDIRKFCPKCGSELVLRTAKRGRGAGLQFWGCSAYPNCRFTMPLSSVHSVFAEGRTVSAD